MLLHPGKAGQPGQRAPQGRGPPTASSGRRGQGARGEKPADRQRPVLPLFTAEPGHLGVPTTGACQMHPATDKSQHFCNWSLSTYNASLKIRALYLSRQTYINGVILYNSKNHVYGVFVGASLDPAAPNGVSPRQHGLVGNTQLKASAAFPLFQD